MELKTLIQFGDTLILSKNSKMGLYTNLSGVISENLVGAQDMRKFPTQSKLPS